MRISSHYPLSDCLYTSGLTQVSSFSPLRPLIRFCAAMLDISLWAATLALAICGTMRQL